MKKSFLFSLIVLFSVVVISCSHNDEPENPSPESNFAEVLFNTTWKQSSVSHGGMNPGQTVTINEDITLEFTDIRYEPYNKYIIKHNSKPIGLYAMISKNSIILSWDKIDPENASHYRSLYGEGRMEIHVYDNIMYYSVAANSPSSITYDYFRISSSDE